MAYVQSCIGKSDVAIGDLGDHCECRMRLKECVVTGRRYCRHGLRYQTIATRTYYVGDIDQHCRWSPDRWKSYPFAAAAGPRRVIRARVVRTAAGSVRMATTVLGFTEGAGRKRAECETNEPGKPRRNDDDYCVNNVLRNTMIID